MGTLGDNLLKLTEFPFSYSFIGLLASMFGQGWNFGDEEFFNRLGPLLILMGFVATTLAITDPIGALQKIFLKYGSMILRRIRYHIFKHQTIQLISYILFKRTVDYENEKGESALLTSPGMKIILPMDIFGGRMWSLFSGTQVLLKEIDDYADPSELIFASLGASFLKEIVSKPERKHLSMRGKMAWVTYDHGKEIKKRLISLRDETLKTTWITREIDKITSTIYFIIVIGTFIPSLFFIPGFEDKFLVTFQGGNQTRNLAIQHIDAAIIAVQANDRGTVITNIEETKEAVKQLQEQLQEGDVRGQWAKLIIIIFSTGALLGILYRLWKRRRELKDNAVMVFRYLVIRETYNVARRTIGIEKLTADKGETFDKTVQAIEQYLTNSDWTLARITVDQIISEYIDLLVTTLQDHKSKSQGEE